MQPEQVVTGGISFLLTQGVLGVCLLVTCAVIVILFRRGDRRDEAHALANGKKDEAHLLEVTRLNKIIGEIMEERVTDSKDHTKELFSLSKTMQETAQLTAELAGRSGSDIVRTARARSST